MSTTSDRIRQMEMALARERLADAPILIQAETLGRHYLSLAQTAQTLLALVEMGRYSYLKDVAKTTTECCAADLIAEIKAAHERDLGVELDWSSDISG